MKIEPTEIEVKQTWQVVTILGLFLVFGALFSEACPDVWDYFRDVTVAWAFLCVAVFLVKAK